MNIINETNLWLLGMSVFFFLLGLFINRVKHTGHFIIGKGRELYSTETEMYLECGCVVQVTAEDPSGFRTQFTLDYSKCRDRK